MGDINIKGGVFDLSLYEKKKFLTNSIYYLIVFSIIYLVFKIASWYLFPFLIGFFIAYFVQRPAKIMSKKIKLKPQICASILSVVFYMMFLTAIVFFAWVLFSCANSLIKFLSNTGSIAYQIDYFMQFIDKIFINMDNELQNTLKKVIDETGSDFISKMSNYLLNNISSLAKKIPSLLINSIVTVVATCYISKDFNKLKMFIKGLISDGLYKKIFDIKQVFTECFFKITIGYCWLFIITFAMLLIGLLILGINQFVLFSFFIAIVDLLPVLGTGIILLPWAIFSFLQADYTLGFGLTILYVVIVIVKNFIEPKVISKQIGINPIFTLVFIFLGLRLGGVIGMILFPIVLTVAFTYYRRQIIDQNKSD